MRTVEIREVGPRDGLQNETFILDTGSKIALIEALILSGIQDIEITSFVNPIWVPQFFDASEVLKYFQNKAFKDVRFTVLVPNLKGAELAISNGAKHIALFMSASEAHNKVNVNMSIDESLDQLKKVAKLANKNSIEMRGYVVTAFGCPYQGVVPIEDVERVCKAYVEMGVKEISLGDTTGMAQPDQVKNLLSKLKPAMEEHVKLAVHFHNTRGLGLVNAYAAFESGINIFDASIGGLGGCPFAPGATGNIATEDLVHMFMAMGVETNVDLKALKSASQFLAKAIKKELPAHLSKAGPIWETKVVENNVGE